MGESVVGEVVHLLFGLPSDELFDHDLPCCVVGVRKVYFFVEELLEILEGAFIGLVGAGDDRNPIVFVPKFVFLHVRNDFLHLGTEVRRTILLLAL